MENFTNEQVEAAVEFYKLMNVSDDLFLVDGKIKDIYSLLNIKPEIDEDGNRKLTPYEILGLLPNVRNGVEMPIVFFVKNKIKNLKRFKSQSDADVLVVKKKEQQNDKDLIEFVLKSYRMAIIQNNLAEAERQFDTLNMLTGGRAKHFIGTFYDYTKFYKQMKKQLMIDLFAHFFLIYLMQKKSIIKKGLIIKNKKFKPFNANKQMVNQSENSDVPQIKSVKVDYVSGSEQEESLVPVVEELDFDVAIKKDIKTTVVEGLKQEVVKTEKTERQSFIKKLKNRLFRKNKKSVNVDYGTDIIKKPFESNIDKEKEVTYE